MVVRWSILSEWKGFANGIIGLSIGIGLFCIMTQFSVKGLAENGILWMTSEDFYLSKIYGFMGITAFIAFYVLGTCIFTNMKTKQKRENFLMLPANNLEKFVARLLLTTIGTFVGIFCSLVIGDILQLIFSFFTTPGFHTSITWAVIKNMILAQFSPDQPSMPIYVCAFLIFAHSFATLGGTFYRKMPTILTVCTSILLSIILGFALNELGHFIQLNANINIDFSQGTTAVYCLEAALTIISLALSAFNYWASYKIFTRMQVICNKWINL